MCSLTGSTAQMCEQDVLCILQGKMKYERCLEELVSMLVVALVSIFFALPAKISAVLLQCPSWFSDADGALCLRCGCPGSGGCLHGAGEAVCGEPGLRHAQTRSAEGCAAGEPRLRGPAVLVQRVCRGPPSSQQLFQTGASRCETALSMRSASWPVVCFSMCWQPRVFWRFLLLRPSPGGVTGTRFLRAGGAEQ